MIFEEFYEYCRQVFALNDGIPQIDEAKAKKLYLLTEHMLKVNQTMNLTAIKDEKAVVLKHYVDSLAVSGYLNEGKTVIDIGCGAGFPTLPLAIFRPDLKILALDSTAKRIEYVKQVARLLELDNVTAIATRAEELANSADYRESFDYATARAVAALPVLTELCLPFVKVGGSFVAMKAQKADEEISNSANAIIKCGGTLKDTSYAPLTDIDGTTETRTIVVVDKIKSTPKEFPRHFSKISKKPL